MSPVTWLLGALNSRLGHLYQPFNIRVLHLTIIMSIVLILFFAVREFGVDIPYFVGFYFSVCFRLHSDTNRRIYIHGGIMDTHGCTLLLFHFIDHDWVRTYTLKSNLYSMTKQFNCLFVCLRIFSLGDYIPGDDPDIDYRSIYKIGTTFYLIMGTWLS